LCSLRFSTAARGWDLAGALTRFQVAGQETQFASRFTASNPFRTGLPHVDYPTESRMGSASCGRSLMPACSHNTGGISRSFAFARIHSLRSFHAFVRIRLHSLAFTCFVCFIAFSRFRELLDPLSFELYCCRLHLRGSSTPQARHCPLRQLCTFKPRVFVPSTLNLSPTGLRDQGEMLDWHDRTRDATTSQCRPHRMCE